jgi:hypothetical protein
MISILKLYYNLHQLIHSLNNQWSVAQYIKRRLVSCTSLSLAMHALSHWGRRSLEARPRYCFSGSAASTVSSVFSQFRHHHIQHGWSTYLHVSQEYVCPLLNLRHFFIMSFSLLPSVLGTHIDHGWYMSSRHVSPNLDLMVCWVW